jgi:carbamoyltransferase
LFSLGLNYSSIHDSSACIARDGKVLFAVCEERLSRVKHDSSFPLRAIRACLDYAGITSEDLDFVCQGWPPPGPLFRHDLKCMLTGSIPATTRGIISLIRNQANNYSEHGGMKIFQRNFRTPKANLRFVDHHLAHAISAYAYSGFDDAAVLVLDGRGAWEATSLWRGHNGRLDPLWTIPFPNSLGLFYAQFTQYLGFTPYSDEWKVMGLAPYGKPGINLDEYIHTDNVPYRVESRLLLGEFSNQMAALEARLGPRRMPESDIDDRHKDLAFAVQESCERAMLQLARKAIAETGSKNLCLAGGVALNSKANGKILSEKIPQQIFVQPAASDDGVCLGAVLAPYLDNGGRLPSTKMRSASLGNECTNLEIEKTLETYKIRATHVSDPSVAAAELLASGKIIGWVQGRMEFGPRALGNRSILADPRDPQMTVKVNNAVKFREWWRPFAPSMLSEVADKFIESAIDSPFMILTAQVRPEMRAVIPAVTHADGSARPQTVERDVNPLYWNLINEFGKRTGVPVVMNTSFNLRGEPIVSSPTDAIRTFFSSGMDSLVIGNFVVEK